MNVRAEGFAAGTDSASATTVLKLAVLAVGGQGGGVLTNWIVALAESQGWRAQATSVAGVAQRTGATIYYVEMAPERAGETRDPVFALSPAPGDVDVVVAAELMEAGRAVTRGFVTPDRTTLIASTHRALAVSEKIAPGDGRSDAAAVRAGAETAARRAVLFDMEAIATEAGSVISASLFGAIAGAEVLPFPQEAFESTIRASGRGVERSLAAFTAAADRAAGGEAESSGDGRPRATEPKGPGRALRRWRALAARADALPAPAAAMARAGLAKVVDFQDLRYGRAYLDAVERACALDRETGGETEGWTLTEAAAKHLATAMAYDDMLRVADLKTRPARFARIREELKIGEEVLHLTEYFHPRAEELCGLMPAPLGRFVEGRPGLFRWLDRRVNRGRRVRSNGALWFAALHVVSALRPLRRITLRHAVETAHREAWFARALDAARRDYALGVEVLKLRRLVKGYSDTHARGLSKFDRALEGVALVEGRSDAADWARRLREAALKDPEGAALDGALATIRSFAGEGATRRSA